MIPLGGEFYCIKDFSLQVALAAGDVMHRRDFRANILTPSTNSIDEILNGQDVDVPEDAWKSELSTRIEQITNLKRSSTEGRAESLHAYAHILMARYANDEIQAHVAELLPSMLKSIRQEPTEREAVKALKGKFCICYQGLPY